jgi:hypothetical protein
MVTIIAIKMKFVQKIEVNQSALVIVEKDLWVFKLHNPKPNLKLV